MIGDWVHYRGTNIRVTSLYDKGGSNEIGWGDKESTWVNGHAVEPIPLTTEILEQNGFKYREWSYDYDRYDQWNLDGIDENGKYNGTLVTINRRKDGHWMDVRCGGNGFWDISHVHHLQHIMRLCGVEKDIKLEE